MPAITRVDMPKIWNDTDVPLAYLITFRCYGTWLHGDRRGSVDRDHNVYGSPTLPERNLRNEYVRGLLKQPPVLLDAECRRSVEAAIKETCAIRKWKLCAIHVRTNHVHCVVCASGKRPEAVLTAFKANATRQMRADKCWGSDRSPWAEKGSRRYLWNEASIVNAIDYVLNGQGDELPNFD